MIERNRVDGQYFRLRITPDIIFDAKWILEGMNDQQRTKPIDMSLCHYYQ